MKILVTGSNGQLGKQIRELGELQKKMTFTFTDQADLDVTDADAVDEFTGKGGYNCIINCASYTKVDDAEENFSEAMNVNATGVKNLAVAAAKINAFMVHLSTDYVFDGTNNIPYNEYDNPNPQTAYGKSKYEGEKEMMRNLQKGLIIRTSWLYSPFGNNFVETIYNKGKEKQQLKVVFDQVGSPTYSYDLASVILDILPEAIEQGGVEVYNFSNEGVASWYDIARAIADIKGLECSMEPVTSDLFPAKAARPHYSVLNKSKIKKTFNIDIPHWRHSLEKCLEKIG